MILFNWPRICKLSGGDTRKIIEIFKVILRKRNGAKLPRSHTDPLYKYYFEDFKGTSFLVQPKILLDNANKYSSKSIAEYIGLAAFRSLAEYKVYRKTTLDLDLSPLKPELINRNQLLHIENNEVHFKYEDYSKEINND